MLAVAMAEQVSLPFLPNVNACTQTTRTPGWHDSKLGIDGGQTHDFLLANRDIPGIRIEGLAVHIGSQLTDIAPYRLAFERLIALYKELRAAGVPLKRLDFGGGIGITYKHGPVTEIGRASCRERVCQYVEIAVVAV